MLSCNALLRRLVTRVFCRDLLRAVTRSDRKLWTLILSPILWMHNEYNRAMTRLGAPRNFVPELSSTYAGPVLVNLVSDIINLLYVLFSQISCPFYRVHRGHPIPFRQWGRKEAQALSYICAALELCCDEQSVCNSYFLNIVVYDTTALLFLHSVFFECCIYIYIYMQLL